MRKLWLWQSIVKVEQHCLLRTVQVNGTRADLSYVEVLEEPFFSRKLQRLIGILSNFRFGHPVPTLFFKILATRAMKKCISVKVSVISIYHFAECTYLKTLFCCFLRLQPDTKCIVFVDRIITARSLAYILENLKFLSFWKCEFLVGVNSGLMSRKNTNIILEKFRSGEVMFTSFKVIHWNILKFNEALKFL